MYEFKKKQDLTTFVTKLRDLVVAQFCEEDRAISGYKVDEKYPKFRYTAAAWCSMSTDQMQKVIKRFRSVTPVVTISVSTDQAATTHLLVQFFFILLGSDYSAEQIWTHATTLLADESNFQLQHKCLDGVQKQRFQTSLCSQKRGHYECDQDCFYFQTCKVCAHIVSIADRNGDLHQFMEWFKKQNHALMLLLLHKLDYSYLRLVKKREKKGCVKKD